MDPSRIERVRRARRGRFYLREERITLSHGAGGKATMALIDGLFLPAFGNPILEALGDQAVLEIEGARLAFTTDSYVVDPLFFPGGDIGHLAVNGTVNDLVTCGAEPLYLSVGFILEEGLPLEDLRRVAASVARAAREAGVAVVTGDTKVVPRGKADRLFLNTAGVGVLRRPHLSCHAARPGDRVLVSGPLGDHGITILCARGELELELDLQSDTAPLGGLVRALLEAAPGTRVLKDPTRGGVATALNEIALASEVGVLLEEAALPVRPEVQGACEILGLDPLYVANEGRLLALVPPEESEAALAALRRHPLGEGAAAIGTVVPEPPGMVLLRTAVGGTRVVDMLAGDPLPRIC
jgi:hydrogenase expression/formation protein HypE